MSKKIKVKVNKSYIKNVMTKDLSYGDAMRALVDNSMKAYEEKYGAVGICNVEIMIAEGSITITDNSGGFKEMESEEKIFQISSKKGKGLKSIFKFGDIINIESNAEESFKVFLLDFNSKSEELEFNRSKTIVKENIQKGTKIYVKNINSRALNDIASGKVYSEVIETLGKAFGEKIKKGILTIKVFWSDKKEYKISSYSIKGKLIEKINIDYLDGEIQLYKKDENEKKGVDFYINDYLIEDRKDLIKIIEEDYNYRNYLIVIKSYGESEELLKEKDKLLSLAKELLKKNSVQFKARNKVIQFEEEANKVKELIDYYDLWTAKAVGKKAFEILYNKYKDEKRKN